MFSPPYGDGTKAFCFPVCYDRFSPPYGDCTDDIAEVEQLAQLSPPYGDCTLNISQNTAKLKSWMARKYSLYYNDVFFALKRTDTNSFGLPCARGSFMI